MKTKNFVLVLILSLSFPPSFSQVVSVPELAKEHFFKQYPEAKNAEWSNEVVGATVRFDLDSNKMIASYNNKGIWKKTTRDYSYEQLPADVLDGFKKSKYSENRVAEVKMIYLPGYVIQYRLKIEKNNVENRFLYFNTEGKLLRSGITL